MSKKFKVLWTQQAALDLEEIVDYIALENQVAALNLFESIKSRCAKLKTSPERYRVVPELKEFELTEYREIILSPYRIIYKLAPATVFVFAVVDGRRDMESFLFHRLIRQ